MTHTPLTKAEREELPARIEAAITTVCSGMAAMSIPANPRDVDLVLADCAKALADLDAAEAEREAHKELIDAARYDVGERSFLEDAQNILKECVAAYSCEQMQAVAKALRQWRDKWAILLETVVRTCEDRDDMMAQRDRAESELDAERRMRVEAETALDERDCDVHARIRAGYDTTVADLWRAKVAEVEAERDALKAKLAAAESAHSELFLSGQVAELKAKLAALVAAVDTEIDNVDHENYPLCGVHDGSRLIGRHLNGAECTCGVQKIRNAIAAARGGAS